MNYKVSIIVAVYNVENFLHNAFESLKRQTIGFENLQVIFADDCSTDRSWDIVKGYAEKYSNVEVLRLPENSGACGTPRNAAMKQAKAKYFMCFDPDDELPEDACELLYDAIEHKDADFAFGYHSTVDIDGMVLNEKPERYDVFKAGMYRLPRDLLLFMPPGIPYWTMICKTGFCRSRDIKFPDKIPGQDTVFKMQYLFESKSAVFVDACVYKYTINQSGISFSTKKSFFQGINRCYRLCYDLFTKYGHTDCFNVFINEVLPYYVNRMLDSNLDDGEILEIFEQWAWLWDCYLDNGLKYETEYSHILSTVFSTDSRLEVFKDLRKLRHYSQELEKAKEWYLQQNDAKDLEIERLEKAKEWYLQQNDAKDLEIERLEKAKEWYLQQNDAKDLEIERLADEINDRNRTIETKDALLNKKLVRIALKLYYNQ